MTKLITKPNNPFNWARTVIAVITASFIIGVAFAGFIPVKKDVKDNSVKIENINKKIGNINKTQAVILSTLKERSDDVKETKADIREIKKDVKLLLINLR